MKYGAITTIDAEVLDFVFSRFDHETVRVLEIGVWKGDTARGIKAALESRGCVLVYVGIDAQAWSEPNPPFPGAQYIICKSEDAYGMVDGDFDVVFQDGCHCKNHVMLDALNYSPMVRIGGFFMFHDTAPQVQHKQTNRWVHPDVDNPVHLTAVNDAIEAIGWPNGRWSLFTERHDPNSDIGGIKVFQRIA